MKKQGAFAENHKVYRVQQDDMLPRCTGTHDAKRVLNVNFDGGQRIQRSPAARCPRQLQHVATVHIPKTMTAAPFLMHTELTPGQKKYLYTIADSYSTEHVRSLVKQHYMNVLHRCIGAGYNPEKDNLVVIPEVLTTQENGESENYQSKVPNRAKHRRGINTGAKDSGKPMLPKIPARQIRPSATTTLKSRQLKKHPTKMPTMKRISPISPWSVPWEDEEELETDEGPDDSLSECMSSLSVGEDDDAFLDSYL